MTLLEKIIAMKLPFAELKGVTFTEASQDRVVARMTVRPDLCTLGHVLHGGAAMALAYDAARVTRDVDAVFKPHGIVLEEARKVADDLGLPYWWLNEVSIQGF